jgi:hypothetical protein
MGPAGAHSYTMCGEDAMHVSLIWLSAIRCSLLSYRSTLSVVLCQHGASNLFWYFIHGPLTTVPAISSNIFSIALTTVPAISSGILSMDPSPQHHSASHLFWYFIHKSLTTAPAISSGILSMDPSPQCQPSILVFYT